MLAVVMLEQSSCCGASKSLGWHADWGGISDLAVNIPKINCPVMSQLSSLTSGTEPTFCDSTDSTSGTGSASQCPFCNTSRFFFTRGHVSCPTCIGPWHPTTLPPPMKCGQGTTAAQWEPHHVHHAAGCTAAHIHSAALHQSSCLFVLCMVHSECAV